MTNKTPNDPTNWIPKEIFLSYLGETDPKTKYATFYDKALSKKNLCLPSWTWGAFFFFPAWLGYRRQKNIFVIYLALITLLLFLETLWHFTIPNSLYSGLAIVLPIYAKGFVLYNANKIYHELKEKGLTNSEITEKMKEQAKKSIGLSVAFFFVMLTVCLLSVMLSDSLVQ